MLTKDEQIAYLAQRCSNLDVEVRFHPGSLYFTAIVPPPWSAERKPAAARMQNTIKEWTRQIPGAVCYCFDSFSTLVYLL